MVLEPYSQTKRARVKEYETGLPAKLNMGHKWTFKFSAYELESLKE